MRRVADQFNAAFPFQAIDNCLNILARARIQARYLRHCPGFKPAEDAQYVVTTRVKIVRGGEV